jgi:uncharacterized protein YndB with AHSA1/START domain
VTIDASPSALWVILTTLDEYADWEPGYASSEYASEQRQGVGAARTARLRSPMGIRRVTHVVTSWEPESEIAWEAHDTNFPLLLSAEQTITLRPDGAATAVENRIVYELRYGGLGRLIDPLVMRRTVNGATEGFLAALARKAAEASDHE